MDKLKRIGELAKIASKELELETTARKNNALLEAAKALRDNMNYILSENEKDMDIGRRCKLSNAMLDRLLLNEARIDAMCKEIVTVAALPDPIGEVIKVIKRPNNLKISQVKVPIGVVGIIYEARPNVTADAAVICLKSGNAVILRGGTEAINSNIAIANVLAGAVVRAGMPEGCIQLIQETDRETVLGMMRLNQYIDVLIPRGGAGLIKSVVCNSTVPYIETGVGNCHIYVHQDADFAMAEEIICNSKVQRPGVCNSIETLLVHELIADKFLPLIYKKLLSYGVEFRGCDRTLKIIKDATKAEQSDWETEFLDLKLAVKIVDSLNEAIKHIGEYGTKHSEVIITDSYSAAEKFLREVDAAAVYVNASTRFTDGSQFGYGSEIGISTQKLHARGPMSINELTSSKYVIYGEGQIRE